MDAKFKVISKDEARRIQRLKHDHRGRRLALGLAYAEAGLLREALAELEALARSNPNSPAPRKLVAAVRAAQGRQ